MERPYKVSILVSNMAFFIIIFWQLDKIKFFSVDLTDAPKIIVFSCRLIAFFVVL